MSFFVNGKTILKGFKRTTNPVTWTDVNGVIHEDYNSFVPKTTMEVIADKQHLNDSGAFVTSTHEWFTDNYFKVNDKVQFNDEIYTIIGVNDYANTGYSNVYQYFLNKEVDKSVGVPVDGGGSDW